MTTWSKQKHVNRMEAVEVKIESIMATLRTSRNYGDLSIERSDELMSIARNLRDNISAEVTAARQDFQLAQMQEDEKGE